MIDFVINGISFSDIAEDEIFAVKKDNYKKTMDFIKSILGNKLIENLINLSDMELDANVKNKNDVGEDYILIKNSKFDIFSSIILDLFPEDKIKDLSKDEYNFKKEILDFNLL